MSRTMLKSLATGVMVIASAAPALAQSKASIQKLNDAWMAAFNKGDAAAVAAMYTDDAYMLPAGAPLVKGRAEIQKFLAQSVQQLGAVKLATLDVTPLGANAAREIGTATFKTKASPPQDGALKYVVVWQKQAGQWKLSTDIWNMDK
jgi:uncharacterized protein (TIGR02246 family)